MKNILDWYWDFGSKRTGEYRIDPGDWLYPLMEIAKRHETAQNALQTRPAIAIWGPSQSGKSILLSRYLDGEAVDGSDSAISWDGGSIFRFAHTPQTPDETQCLNPVTSGKDATGVVTRYVSRETIPDVCFPVELKLADPAQWLYAFSIGYLNLCTIDEIRTFNEIDLRHFVEQFSVENPTLPANEAACESLFTLTEILGAFIETREDRFSNLGRNNQWKTTLRSMLFNAPQLNQSKENVEHLMAQLFWDDSKAINDVVAQIRLFQDVTIRAWKKKPIYCTLEAAKLLLDFQTLDKCESGSIHKDHDEVLRNINRLSWTETSDSVKLGFDLDNPIRLDNFGCLQTLTAELQIPVQINRIHNKVFQSLLKRFDIIDFPGVTNMTGREGTPETVDLSQMSPEKCKHTLFTTISKYGKTLSLVFSSAKHLSIDAFLLLLKTSTDQLARNPRCIQTSIQEWANQLGFAKGQDASLYLDISFFDIAINRCMQTGIGFDEVMKHTCEQLPCTSNPGKVSTFITNYPWLGNEHNLSDYSINQILERAGNEPLFQKFIPDWQKQLQELYTDGGVDYMLNYIGEVLNPEIRRRKIRQLLEMDTKRLVSLLESKLPTMDDVEVETKKNNLKQIIFKLENFPDIENRLIDLCGFLKKIMYVDFDILEPLPIHVTSGRQKVFADYLRHQINLWIENKLMQFDAENEIWNDIFNENGDGSAVFRMFLRTVVEGSNLRELELWVSNSLKHYQTNSEAGRARLLLSLGISNLLWSGQHFRIEKEKFEPKEKMQKFTKLEENPSDYRNAVLYCQILQPFIERCNQLSNGEFQASYRPAQPGDTELQKILDNIQSIINIV